MIDKKITQIIVQTILSHDFIAIDELSTLTNISSIDLASYIDEITIQFSDLGIMIDLVEINSKDYVIALIPTKEKVLSDIQLGLLSIFAILIKSFGGKMSSKEMELFLLKYPSEIDSLTKNKYIYKEIDNYWYISPLGVVTILPNLEEVKPLIIKLYEQNKNN